MSIEQFTPELEALRKASLAVLKNAYCCYSNFPVGAALIGKDGKIYTGVNVENASFPCGWCAEVSAFGATVTAVVKEFKAMAVATDRDDYVSPCGQCRQVIIEFCAGTRMPLLLVNRKRDFKKVVIEDLHPMTFRSSHLKNC
ncbi:unnamed protein product [Dibothriocephalus latus]|uniref:Cytidine deaminase n=1 Tax=Dibothriocephalus latus TaxID=60516 RepID=A0A3P7LXC5_DIBLA|nr:unnamed protein product [Dibothriocephalus latus]